MRPAPRASAIAEWVAVCLVTTLGLAAAAWLHVDGFLAAVVVGGAVGAMSRRDGSVLAVAVGTMLSLPTALILGSILFLGDAWFVGMGISILLAGAGFLIGRNAAIGLPSTEEDGAVRNGFRRGEHPNR